jgi:GNAT superfamily N-acetyltransferase
MEDKIKIQKQEYQKDKSLYLKPFEEEMNIKIKNCEFVSDNEIFKKLMEDFPSIEGVEKVVYSDIYSLIQISPYNRFKMKYHNSITFFLPDDSHLRFSPHKNGLEITRLYIQPENQGIGLGTYLMNKFLHYLEYELYVIPEILVELTGAVGYGKSYINSNIETQTKFYEKFGFVSQNYISHNNIMIREEGLPFV